MTLNKRQTGGFTVIELMIASTVFSAILLLCAAALIHLGRVYQKNLIRSQTQETTRTVMSNISESIQFSNGKVSTPPTDGNDGDPNTWVLCIGNKIYSYKLNKKLESSGVLRLKTGSCGADPTLDLSGGTELLAPNMRLRKLRVESVADTNLYNISLEVAYGDDDLFDGVGNCISSRFGGSFCAVSSLNTTVQRRVID